jgi:hypothetical protein
MLTYALADVESILRLIKRRNIFNILIYRLIKTGAKAMWRVNPNDATSILRRYECLGSIFFTTNQLVLRGLTLYGVQ